jgi:hypothetical protein
MIKRPTLSTLNNTVVPHLLSMPSFFVRFSRRIAATLNLSVVVGMTTAVWGMTATVVPQMVHAETTRMLIPLNREPGETYDTLIRRAEATARVLTQRSFNNNLAVTDVSITITAEREGLVAPLLRLATTREQWNSRPEPQYWTTYFKATRALLGLDGESGSEPLPLSSGALSPVPGTASSTSLPQLAPTAAPSGTIPNSSNSVQIDLPASPSGQLGLPRS